MKFDNHYCSDIEPYAVELYKKRFPDSIQLGDIKEIDCEKLMADAESKQSGGVQQPEFSTDVGTGGQNWIITGGFPCQDISVAGKGEGIGGGRSGLWFEMRRIIRDLRPRWVIAENVGALAFRGLGAVLNSLAEIGYDAEWQDIRAEDMGAPHRRERIWIVAYPGHRSGGDIGTVETGQDTPGKRAADTSPVGGSSEQSETVANTNRNGAQRDKPEHREGGGVESRGQERSDSVSVNDDNGSHGAGAICGEQSGQTEIQRGEHWITEPAVCGISNELSKGLDKVEPYNGV